MRTAIAFGLLVFAALLGLERLTTNIDLNPAATSLAATPGVARPLAAADREANAPSATPGDPAVPGSQAVAAAVAPGVVPPPSPTALAATAATGPAVAAGTEPVATPRDRGPRRASKKTGVRSAKAVTVEGADTAAVPATSRARRKSREATAAVVVRRGGPDAVLVCPSGQTIDHAAQTCLPAKRRVVASSKKKPTA